jgi:hypothetical protein
MKELVNLFGLFKETATFLSKSIYAMLNLIYPTIFTIKSIFEDNLLWIELHF